MTLPNATVLAQFDEPTAADFIFDDPTTGLFDVGTFSGGASSDISEYVTALSLRRGRSGPLDNVAAGTCSITLDDPDRVFDAANTTSPYFGKLGPGRLFVVQVHGVTVYSGRTTGYASTDDFAYGSTKVTVQLEDLLATLSRRPMTAWTSTEQLPGARIAAVLNRSEVDVPEAQRDIDDGVSTLQSENTSHGSSTTNYLQLVSRSDLGLLFASVDDVLTFRDRVTLQLATPVLTITDDPADDSEIEPRRVIRSNSARDTYNRVTVDREGGIATAVQLPADEIREQGGLRTLSITGLLLKSDLDSVALAEWLLYSTSEPANRVTGIAVEAGGLPLAQIQALSMVELGSRLIVTYTPTQTGDPVDTTVSVDSIAAAMTSTSHTITFGVSEVPALTNGRSTTFLFDDATYGLFDGPGTFIF